MKTLHLYLTRQVLATLAMTVATFALLLLLGNVLKEILALLVNRQATLAVVGRAIWLLIPFVMVFALPMGLLTATLLVFGRFSADQELTAAKASGISLVALATPILLLSVVLSGVAGWFNLEVAPAARVAYKQLLARLGLEQGTGLLGENQFVKDFPGFVIYVGQADGDRLKRVVVYQYAPGQHERPERICSAPEAQVLVNPTNRQVSLHFPAAEVVLVAGWQPMSATDFELELPVNRRPPETLAPKLTEMTFRQLLNEFYERRRQGIDAMPVQVQLHRQVAFSFAGLGFALIGIPLGIRAHRRETSAGVAMALILVLIYYSFIILGQAWETYPSRQPHLILWVPNFLFQLLGGWLLWRANRRG